MRVRLYSFQLMRAGYYYIERGKRTENSQKRTENSLKRTENDRKQPCLQHKQPIKVKILISFGKSFGGTEKY